MLLFLACTTATLPSHDGDLADSASSDSSSPVEQVPGADWARPEADPSRLPSGVPVLAIEIDPAEMARMDLDPYEHEDAPGVFIDEDGRRVEVDLSYRGAYQLRNVINGYDLRNWKVKFPKDDPYADRREWNFNYEPHLRQKLAYDLFRFAGVPTPEAQHVRLVVNGEEAGVYLQYADPDSLGWLADWFGDDEGDLYKAGYDLPGREPCWADLTWLGDEDADYLCHYNKKTNLGETAEDHSTLRSFITALNEVSDAELPAWIEQALDLDAFLSYLVVSNFIANWDSYPQRPKNYWLYEDRRAGRMVVLPWDLDGTLSPWTDSTFNQMGTTAPLLYNLLESDYTPPHAEEGRERPLVRRLMAQAAYQEAYIARYRELAERLLNEDYLGARVDGLTENLRPALSNVDRDRLDGNEAGLRQFIRERSAYVEEALAD